MKANHAHKVAGGELLKEISRELERLAMSVESMQAAVSPLIASHARLDAKSSAALQEFDYTCQVLANLADLNRLLSDAASNDWTVQRKDVVSRISLSELLSRLLDEGAPFRVSNGDFEAF